MEDQRGTFQKLISNPLKFKIFLLKKLPAGFFTGLSIEHFNAGTCAVSVPYKWLNKNPFRSTYFASLAMAAELSTGALAMANVFGSRPAVSMLVTGLQATYFKKAVCKTIFTCNDGEKFETAVSTAVKTGVPQIVEAISTGLSEAGDLIATFTITWSFKVKSHK